MPERWLEFLSRHGGKILCTGFGLIFALTVLHKGLFAALFLCLCLFIGYLIGKSLDEGHSLSWLWGKMFPPR